MKIKIINSVYSEISRSDIFETLNFFKYKNEFWKQGRYRKERREYDGFAINKKTGEFLTGLIPEFLEYCKKKKIDTELEFENQDNKKYDLLDPKLKGIILRADQTYACNKIKKDKRGMINFPTGSGKTIIACAFMSMLKNYKTLFLCDTTDIYNQTIEKCMELDLNSYCGFDKKIGESKDYLKYNIVIAKIKGFINNTDPNDYCEHFDCVIVDECHHARGDNSQYATVLKYLAAEYKIGLSGTIPKKEKNKKWWLSLNGLFGPIIADLDFDTAISSGIIAIPNIRFIPVKKNKSISRLKTYKDIYRRGIINNKTRNKLIVDIVKENIKKSETTLIIVDKIKHGENIVDLASFLNIRIEFVQGKSHDDFRKKIKVKLNNKKIKAVVCTTVWLEGTNIPTLNNVILAFGGKSDARVVQAFGRGSRVIGNKMDVTLYDFLDPYKYLSEHFIERMQIYINCGLIK